MDAKTIAVDLAKMCSSWRSRIARVASLTGGA